MSTPKRPSMDRLVELQQLISDFAHVERMIKIGPAKRPENDVEHSFGLAVTAWFVAEHIAPDLDMEKVLKYALIHDLVEIYAGDTFSHAPASHLTAKKQREQEALARLAREWPDFPDLIEYVERYEQRTDEESKFVYAVDKILPPLMSATSDKAEGWKRHKITHEMEKKQKAKIMESKVMAPYYQDLINWEKANGYFYDPAA